MLVECSSEALAGQNLAMSTVAPRASDEARQSAQRVKHSHWVERAGRIGFVSMGISYGIVAILAILVALGHGGKTTSRTGALQAVANKPFGAVLLVLLAIGFLAYAVWRFVEAFLDRGNEGHDASGVATRAGSFARGIIYCALFWSVVQILSGRGAKSNAGSNSGARKDTSAILSWPGGRWIVGAIALGIILYGAYDLYRAVSRKFREQLKEGEMSPTTRTWVERLGSVGYAARGTVFVLIGIFLGKAAWDYAPRKAVGLDGALRKLADHSYGPVLLGLVAVGLLAYGLYCEARARYGDV
jgi:hypothetical protein